MKKFSFLLCTLLLGTLYSCTNLQVNLPPVSADATGTRLPGKVIWHDLVTEDPAAAKRFYGGLFGWKFKAVEGGDYTLIMHDGLAIGGLVDARKFTQQGDISQWVVVLSVDDVDRAVDKLKLDGGVVYGGPTDVGERGRLALVQDPQGANVALLQTRDGDPLDRAAGVDDFMWNELWTSDVAAATRFYTDLAGYRPGELTLANGDTYHYLKTRGEPRVAVLANPVADLAPTWVAYVRVEDTEATSARVEGLGGQLMLPPQASPSGGELAIIRDPSGAGLVIQTWSNHQPQSTDQQESTP